jgi:hypothetical protein
MAILPPHASTALSVTGEAKYPCLGSKPTKLRKHQRTHLNEKKIISQEDNIDEYSK